MNIWVDADACPVAIKDILFRAAKRTETPLILVANTNLTTPNSRFISTVRVEQGFDRADHYIVEHVAAFDLVITADIPLAADVIAKQGTVLNPRGDIYTANNINQRLGLRDIMDQARGAGLASGGPPALRVQDRTAFANALDKILAKLKNSGI